MTGETKPHSKQTDVKPKERIEVETFTNKKFMLSLKKEVYDYFNDASKNRGITIQELVRATILGEVYKHREEGDMNDIIKRYIHLGAELKEPVTIKRSKTVKFMQSLKREVYDYFNNYAKNKGISMQEFVRANILGEIYNNREIHDVKDTLRQQ